MIAPRRSHLALLLATLALATLVGPAWAAKKDAAKTPAAPVEKRTPAVKRPPMLPSAVFAPLLEPMAPLPAGAGTLTGPTLGATPGADVADEPEAPGADPVFAAFQRGLWVRAFKLAIPRAEAGDTAAMTMLGNLYETGLGVKIDQAKAAEWYGLGAVRGDREAAAALAQMHVEGRGVKRDLGRALELFRAAAAQDQPVALFNLAMMTLRGDAGVPRDPRAAADLLARAADQGNVEAQYALASQLSDPHNPAHDPVQAAKWMREAAMAGFEAAEVEFALMLANGKGVEKNLADALVWFHRSALRGNAIGRNRLARMYAVGLGVDPDPVEAWKWHSLAKRQGLSDLWLETRLADMSHAQRQRAELMADTIAGGPAAAPPPRPGADDDVADTPGEATTSPPRP